MTLCSACGRPVDELFGWNGSGHVERYRQAVAEYERARRVPPDRYWRALLRLLTALPGLWLRIRPHVDMPRGAVTAPRGLRRTLSTGEHVLLDVALCLYRGRGSVDLGAVADHLDPVLFEVVLATLRDFRSWPSAKRRLTAGAGA